jgi:hypothetical protein
MELAKRTDRSRQAGGGDQVPEAALTIADRICQKRHHDWIEVFLVQHQGASS